MNKKIWMQGIEGSMWGVWDFRSKSFCFDISEETPMLANARLCQRVGSEAKADYFNIRQLPKGKNNGDKERTPSEAGQ